MYAVPMDRRPFQPGAGASVMGRQVTSLLWVRRQPHSCWSGRGISKLRAAPNVTGSRRAGGLPAGRGWSPTTISARPPLRM